MDLNPDRLIITGGVLSSNASESHLNARPKTPEELEMERQSALAIIRERVAKKQITLSEAPKLKNDVDITYGYSVSTKET